MQNGSERTIILFSSTIDKECFHNTPNNNVIRLVNFAASHDIINNNTYFSKKNIYKQIQDIFNTTTKNQIDHVTIDKGYRSWFKTFEVVEKKIITYADYY